MRAGICIFILIAISGCSGSSDSASQTTSQPDSVNQAPMASAGDNQQVNEQTEVTLQGSASDNEDGNNLSVTWRVIVGSVSLTNANSLNPSFEAPTVLQSEGSIELEFELEVIDSGNLSARDRVTVTVNYVNEPPEIGELADIQIEEQQPLSIAATVSDSDGTVDNYEWIQTDGEPVMLSGQNTEQLSFSTPIVLVQEVEKILNFRLTVTDNEGATSNEEVLVRVTPNNSPPIINISDIFEFEERSIFELQANVTDLDGTIVSLEWMQVSGPMELELEGIDTDTIMGTAPEALSTTRYAFELQVNDNEGATQIAMVNLDITPVDDPPVVFFDSLYQGREGETITVEAVVSDPDNNLPPEFATWEHISGPVFNYFQPESQSVTVVLPALENDAVSTIRITVTDDTNLTTHVDVDVETLVNNALINDTGVVVCGDYAADTSLSWQNDANCNATTDNDGDPIPQRQDGSTGRDVHYNDDTDGHAGFSFTKIDLNGNDLPHTSEEWSCVRDNVTNLYWEVKTNDGSLLDYRRTFDWYDSSASTNGGYAGGYFLGDCDGETFGASCVTETYISDVNEMQLCGFSDWRLPNREELRSIRSMQQLDGAIDIDLNFFSHSSFGNYWTSVTHAGDRFKAWAVHFDQIKETSQAKTASLAVRLVRHD